MRTGIIFLCRLGSLKTKARGGQALQKRIEHAWPRLTTLGRTNTPQKAECPSGYEGGPGWLVPTAFDDLRSLPLAFRRHIKEGCLTSS
ncbi:hypothetical protein M8J75_014784 [Diaphorina citri]|nr:hypothetical protein M8J75_014784 [Diaphorina citri]